jgi:hypothetical protein
VDTRALTANRNGRRRRCYLAGRAGLQRLHLPEDHNRCLSREHALLPLVDNGQHQWVEATAAPDETTLEWPAAQVLQRKLRETGRCAIRR